MMKTEAVLLIKSPPRRQKDGVDAADGRRSETRGRATMANTAAHLHRERQREWQAFTLMSRSRRTTREENKHTHTH